MRTFACVCGNPVFFQNTACQHCGRTLGFLPDRLQIVAIEPAGQDLYRADQTTPSEGQYRQCNNYRFEQVCNWLIEADDPSIFCRACRLNHMIPDLTVAQNRERWYRTENAKRHLLYSLFRLTLPVVGRDEDPKSGLTFDFLDDPATGQKVYTGHDNGLITINVAEADDSRREQTRESMGERYRTLLGHFRHEIGHFYWQQLVAETRWISEFRTLFGDERADYDDCMNRHYAEGAPTDWQTRFVSAYASSHPWEDWAESWAHYLHITDTLETAACFELTVRGTAIQIPPLLLDLRSQPAQRSIFDQQMAAWGLVTVSMNAISRSMGMPDLYPFVLSTTIYDKFYFIHRVIAQTRSRARRRSLH